MLPFTKHFIFAGAMQKLSAFFLVSLISIQAFYNLGLTAYWVANHSYIASVLCENRDKPAEHCDGKCYLKKKLNAASQDSAPASQNLPKSLKKGIEISEFLLEDNCFRFNPLSIQSNLISTIPGCCSIEPARRIFHPPVLTLA